MLADESVRADAEAAPLGDRTTAQSQEEEVAAEEAVAPSNVSGEPAEDESLESPPRIGAETSVAAGEVPPEDGTSAEFEEEGGAAGGEPEEVTVADASEEDDHRELPIILPEEVATELDEPGIRRLVRDAGFVPRRRNVYYELLPEPEGEAVGAAS